MTWSRRTRTLFYCPRFKEERERFQLTWKGPLTPEGMGCCLLWSQMGWDAVETLATSIVERLNSHQEERRKKRSQHQRRRKRTEETQQQRRVKKECL